MDFNLFEVKTTLSNEETEFGWLPSVHTSIDEYDDEDKYQKVFEVQGYLFDPVHICDDTFEVFDSISGDLEQIYAYAFDDKNALKLIRSKSESKRSIPRCLIVNRAYNHSSTHKRLFVDVVEEIMKQTGAHIVIFVAGDIDNVEVHNKADLCRYYESLDGVTILDKEHSVYMYSN